MGIAELKARLSHYLRRVERGERIQVCDRHRKIAELGPALEVVDALELATLRGEIRAPLRSWSELKISSLPEKVDAQAALRWVRGEE